MYFIIMSFVLQTDKRVVRKKNYEVFLYYKFKIWRKCTGVETLHKCPPNNFWNFCMRLGVYVCVCARARVCVCACVRVCVCVDMCIYIWSLLTILDHKKFHFVYFIVYNLIPVTSSMWLNSTQKFRTTALEWYKREYYWITSLS